MTDARRPKLELQGSIVTKARTDAVRLSGDNWKEVLPFLSLGDQLRATTACCELVLNGRAFFGQQRSIPLRFAAANLGKGVSSLGGAGRFGALRYVNLVGQIGLASLTPPFLEILAASTSLEVATATVRLRTIAEVSASDQLARNCPKLRIQATLDLSGACPTHPFRALVSCSCFGACCLPPPPPLPPPSRRAFWLRGLTVSGGVC